MSYFNTEDREETLKFLKDLNEETPLTALSENYLEQLKASMNYSPKLSKRELNLNNSTEPYPEIIKPHPDATEPVYIDDTSVGCVVDRYVGTTEDEDTSVEVTEPSYKAYTLWYLVDKNGDAVSEDVIKELAKNKLAEIPDNFIVHNYINDIVSSTTKIAENKLKNTYPSLFEEKRNQSVESVNITKPHSTIFDVNFVNTSEKIKNYEFTPETGSSYSVRHPVIYDERILDGFTGISGLYEIFSNLLPEEISDSNKYNLLYTGKAVSYEYAWDNTSSVVSNPLSLEAKMIEESYDVYHGTSQERNKRFKITSPSVFVPIYMVVNTYSVSSGKYLPELYYPLES